MIKELPEYDTPDVFGMNINAEVSYQTKESLLLMQQVLDLQPVESGAKDGGLTAEEQILGMVAKFQEEFPGFILREGENTPTILDFSDSLEVCVAQEAERFNSLLIKIESSLENLKKAVNGEIILSEELDLMFQDFVRNKVPENWLALSYASLKPLSTWFPDLILRVAFFKDWYLIKKPACYWLSAFFYPQGFLTSVLQNHSRASGYAIDKLNFSFDFKNMDVGSINEGPDSGVLIRGLFMEGCRFDPSRMALVDNEPGVMHSEAPIIHFNPQVDYEPNITYYPAPLYKTIKRAGKLLATGHSTNFVLSIYCPTKSPIDYWILNGAAFLCALN